MSPKIIIIPLPEYTISQKPDYLGLGKKVDRIIEKNFEDGWYMIRALSMDDHPEKSVDELVNIIINAGTDRYDPTRKSVCHNQFKVYNYDLHLGSFEIKGHKIQTYEDDTYPTCFGEGVYNFYENTPLDRGYRVRLDLLVFYDPEFFEPAKSLPEYKNIQEHPFRKYLYRFKDKYDRKNAVKGIVKLLRK